MEFLRPIYYLIIGITLIVVVANKKGYISNETIVSTWNDETDSWEEISRSEESVHIEDKTDWIFNDDGTCIRVDETWTYRPGSKEPEHEVWVNGVPLNRTIRDGGHVIGQHAIYAWHDLIY